MKLTGLNFNISAAVGFISILGVAVMNGLLFVSAFNALRARGVALDEALMQRHGQLVRPVMMTALAAILGLLAGGPLDEDGLGVAAAAGHRRGRRHAHDPHLR